MNGVNPAQQPQQVIEDHPRTDAAAFLRDLSPQAQWWQPDPSLWLFRGHSKESYELKAKVHRDGEDFCARYGVSVRARSADEPRWSIDGVRLAALTRAFGDALDAGGLAIPSPSPKLQLENSSSRSGDPLPGAMPLVALMQHMGLPTPWLDWTTQARVAAYFASAGAAGRQQSEGLVVWALRRDFVGRADELGGDIKLVSAPRATNARLHAQGGVFTWLRSDDAHSTTVDAFVRDTIANAAWPMGTAHHLPVMRRFALPASEAPTLLRLLSYEGVSAASVFPGYEGVVRAMEERARWDRR